MADGFEVLIAAMKTLATPVEGAHYPNAEAMLSASLEGVLL